MYIDDFSDKFNLFDWLNEETILLITLWIYKFMDWLLFGLLDVGVGQKVPKSIHHSRKKKTFIKSIIWLFDVFLWNFVPFFLVLKWGAQIVFDTQQIYLLLIANFTDIRCPHFEIMSLTTNRLRVSHVGKNIIFLMCSISFGFFIRLDLIQNAVCQSAYM